MIWKGIGIIKAQRAAAMDVVSETNLVTFIRVENGICRSTSFYFLLSLSDLKIPLSSNISAGGMEVSPIGDKNPLGGQRKR